MKSKGLVLFSLAASACALAPPDRLQNRALGVRGGETSALVKTGAALFGAQGLAFWMSPTQAMNAYGIGEVSDKIALWELRAAGAWQLGLAALLTLDPATAVDKSHFVAAACLLPYFVFLEDANGPKEPMVFWVAVCIALGKFAHFGKVPQWVSPALYLANGAQCYFATQTTAQLYGIGELSPLAASGLRVVGAVMLSSSAYLGSLAAGLEPSQAFAAAWAVIAVHTVKTAFTDCVEIGASSGKVLAWAVVAAGFVGHRVEFDPRRASSDSQSSTSAEWRLTPQVYAALK